MGKINKTDFDTIIVGGGPAGVACGIILQKAGRDNCILDKAVFPRHKLCGGLLTTKTQKLLEELCDGKNEIWMGAVKDEIKRAALYHDGKMLCDAPIKEKYFISERSELDFNMINHYKALGGNLFEGDAVMKVDVSKKELITESGRVFRFNYLVACDGANSRIRGQLGKQIKNVSFCLEESVLKNQVPSINSDQIQLHFGPINHGYGWVFPCGEKVKVGFGGICPEGYPYKKKFEEYKSINKIPVENENFKGAFLPYGDSLKHPTHKDNIIFAGDAAGMVDPISGEGIYFGYLSGKLAGECICSGDDAVKLYEERAKHIHQIIKDGAHLQNIFFREIIQKKVIEAAGRHSKYFSYFLDEMVSDYHSSYKDIIKTVIKKARSADRAF